MPSCHSCDKTIAQRAETIECIKCNNVVCHKKCVPASQAASWTCTACSSSGPDGLTLQHILAAIEASSAKQEKMLKDTEANLGAAIENCTATVSVLTAKVESLEKNVGSLEVDNEQLRNRVSELEAALLATEQYSRVNDVDVVGIPCTRGENVDVILDSLGKALHFPLSRENVEVAHRTGPASAM